ncbi:MAG: hypothetical protein M3Z28_06130, partial [Candidatus Dormibacteraeota bacterium]|nr:hypothetical protein [Candidatus Dormibacteraeota bacterium]
MPNPNYRTRARTASAMAVNPQTDTNPAHSHNLTRHGGPVLKTTTNYLIWWIPSGGPQLSSYYQAIVRRFFRDVSGSDLYKAMTQYDGGSGAISSQATLGGEWTDTSAYRNGLGTQQNPLQDSDITDEIGRAIDANSSWEKGDDHVIYYVFLAPNAQQCDTNFSKPSCTFFNNNPPFKGNGAFCAYHSQHFDLLPPRSYNYASMPDADSLNCGFNVFSPFGVPTGSPNFDQAADEEASVLSHEYFETITNAHGDAWYDDSPTTDPTIFNGYEIGDKCNAMAGPQYGDQSDVHLHGNPYLIQMEWSNSAHNCVIPGADQGALQYPLSACRDNSLPANDDGSTGQLTLPFTANFFGQTFTSLWANNNGNVTFDGPQYIYTPYPLTTTNHSIIAPFFADVDTRGDHSGLLTYGSAAASPGAPAYFCANWINVGYYPASVDKLNSFQLMMIDRSGDPGGHPGDFDIVFNYDKVTWETGSASGGVGGLGGSSARVGYSNGVNRALELPGSAINGALLDGGSNSLVQGSANSPIRGHYVFPVRNGAAPTGGT